MPLPFSRRRALGVFALPALLPALLPGVASAQAAKAADFAGRYRAFSGDRPLDLVLVQTGENTLGGRLGTVHGPYEVRAQVHSDGKISGLVRGLGTIFFAGNLEEGRLRILFAEPDSRSQPNLATSRQVNFVRQK